MKKRKRGFRIKKKSIQIIIALAILIIGIYAIYALVDFNKAWHSPSEIIVSIDGCDVTLQNAIDNNYLDGTVTPAICLLQSDFPDAYHLASEILITSDGFTMTLQEAITNSVLKNGVATQSYTTEISGTSHLSTAIEVFIDDTFMSLQDAITGGKFIYVPYLWNKTIGGSGYDSSYGITTDSLGNVYVTGETTSFGEGNYDIWTIKYDSDGNQIWNKTIGGSSTDRSWDITADSSGNIYVTGHKYVGTSNYDIWTIKYDSDGNQIWDRIIGGSRSESGEGITTDSSGNIYVTGYTMENFATKEMDIWTIKYDSDGNKIWDRTIGGSGYDGAYGITADSSGNIYVIGNTNLFGAQGFDFWTIKYDSAGNKIWDRTIGRSANDYGKSITIDSSENIYVTGDTRVGSGNYDIWTIKYDSNGNKIWDRTIGGSGNDHGRGITADSSGNIYVAGYTESFGEGNYDIWTIKYDSDGNQIWNKTIGGSSTDRSWDITTDPSGNIYVTGETMSFGEGGYDVWTIKIQ